MPDKNGEIEVLEMFWKPNNEAKQHHHIGVCRFDVGRRKAK
jgi:hypothetical protein